MRIIMAVLLCAALVFGCGLAAAEGTPQKEDYTIVTVNGVFNIRGITPEGYQLSDISNDSTTIGALFMNADAAKPWFQLVISFVDEYAAVDWLNDLSEDDMKNLVGDDPTVSDQINIMETDYGTKVMILRAADPTDDFACFVTLYKGYEVGLNLFPGPDSDGTLTDEQIALAMKFLSDLDFVPITAGE